MGSAKKRKYHKNYFGLGTLAIFFLLGLEEKKKFMEDLNISPNYYGTFWRKRFLRLQVSKKVLRFLGNNIQKN